MALLRWPDGRGKFVDDGRPSMADPPADATRERFEVYPGTEVEVDDPDRIDHYLERGFIRVDGSGESESGADAGDPDSDIDGDVDGDGDVDADSDAAAEDFDVTAFLDRTPVGDVVNDIENGEADGHLDSVIAAADRVTVERAAEDRAGDDDGGD